MITIMQYILFLEYTFMCMYTFTLIVTGFWKTVSKSHMKFSVFLHVFNIISTYAYVFTVRAFLTFLGNLSIEFHVVL